MGFQRIDCAAAAEKLQAGAVLLDIRDASSFAAGHAPGAQHLSNQNAASLLQALDPDAPLLVMCYHGHSSQGAAQFLLQQGFSEVYSVDGGFEQWKLLYAVEKSV